MAPVDTTIWQAARRVTLLKSSHYRINLKYAQNKELCRKHAFYIRFYYKCIKRPTLKIYIPLRNWVIDYYEVGKDCARFAKGSPVRAAFYWMGLFIGVIAFWTKPGIEEFKRDFRDFNAHTAQMVEFCYNEPAKEFSTKINSAIGRHQIATSNFIFLTLYYHSTYGSHVYNPVSTCEEMSMSFIDRMKATVDIGMFGTHWLMRWHYSDVDVPNKNMFGSVLVDPKPENFFVELFRRLRLLPKYVDLLVEPREERFVRAVGLIQPIEEASE